MIKAYLCWWVDNLKRQAVVSHAKRVLMARHAFEVTNVQFNSGRPVREITKSLKWNQWVSGPENWDDRDFIYQPGIKYSDMSISRYHVV